MRPRTSTVWLIYGLIGYFASSFVSAAMNTHHRTAGALGGRPSVVGYAVFRGLLALFLGIRLTRHRSRRRIAWFLLVLSVVGLGVGTTILLLRFDGIEVPAVVLDIGVLGCALQALRLLRSEPTDQVIEAAVVAEQTQKYQALQRQAFEELRRRNEERARSHIVPEHDDVPPGSS